MFLALLVGFVVHAASLGVTVVSSHQIEISVSEAQLDARKSRRSNISESSRLILATRQIPSTQLAPASSPAASPGTSPASALGICGCPRKTDQCTCGAWLGYLDCITSRCQGGQCPQGCHAGAETFQQHCDALAVPIACGSELEFSCGVDGASCHGKFHQMRDSIFGLQLINENLTDAVLCGPWGKCQGELHLRANIYNDQPGMLMECVLPKKAGADKSDQNAWLTCGHVVSGSSAVCAMPMAEDLEAGDKLEGRCWLQKDGKKITKSARFFVQNSYRAAESDNRRQTQSLRSRASVAMPVLSFSVISLLLATVSL